MSSSSTSTKSAIPDGIYFELSPRIVLGVRIVNVLVLLMVVITFIMCLVRGGIVPAYYLLACNTVISACVGIVVNWWYRSGDLGSEKYWYILVVAAVLFFQCITTDVFIFKTEENPGPTTQSFTWATFRHTTNKTLLQLTTPTFKH
ncbi:uncharacterized protein LOC143292969 [Babylonia areolata]|uniref:uncharacterized protein LOC143292969 n=1 Tax=Babylonia areolata TaxID=304850 RepID=UPI003FD1FDCE